MNHQTDRNRHGPDVIPSPYVRRSSDDGPRAGRCRTTDRRPVPMEVPDAWRLPNARLAGVSQGLDEATIDGEVSAGDIASPVAS